jgi:hypothetical protein
VFLLMEIGVIPYHKRKEILGLRLKICRHLLVDKVQDTPLPPGCYMTVISQRLHIYETRPTQKIEDHRLCMLCSISKCAHPNFMR